MQFPHRYFYPAIVCLILSIFLINSYQANASSKDDSIVPTSTLETPLRPTPTSTIQFTDLPTATPSTTPTITITSTPTIEPTPLILFTPLLFNQPPNLVPDGEPVKLLFCNQESIDIPDNNPSGATSLLTIDESRFLVDLDVRINVTHSWIGDIQTRLTHQETGKSIDLIDRPGVPASSSGCETDNIVVILDDDISSPVENKCSDTAPAISGSYIPNQPLHTFDGDRLSGSWILTISDNNNSDVGKLNDWCLAAAVYENPLLPTEIPQQPELPTQAFTSGISGKSQALPLDCESRSAVDWANYFGVYIDELTFFNQLPLSDNPDAGFVGSVYGNWGQIPPAPYGVHAEPVAELLREHGLNAYAHRPLSWDELRAEISAGRPVIVWIVGSVINGIPIYYQTPDGHITTVAPYEHTVIVTGYTDTRVYFLNGSYIYSKSIDQFLDSWSVMGNMAITAKP